MFVFKVQLYAPKFKVHFKLKPLYEFPPKANPTISI